MWSLLLFTPGRDHGPRSSLATCSTAAPRAREESLFHFIFHDGDGVNALRLGPSGPTNFPRARPPWRLAQSEEPRILEYALRRVTTLPIVGRGCFAGWPNGGRYGLRH